MIARLNGILRRCTPTSLELDVHGIVFELTVPLSTSRVLPEPGVDALLFVVSSFTREGLALYGFATPEEKTVFERITAARGIGPKAALNLLSRFSAQEVLDILNAQKVETLKTVPGIGPKKAALILGRLQEAPTPAAAGPGQEQAVTALITLGLTRAEAVRRLEQVPERSALSLTELLTRALKMKD